MNTQTNQTKGTVMNTTVHTRMNRLVLSLLAIAITGTTASAAVVITTTEISQNVRGTNPVNLTTEGTADWYGIGDDNVLNQKLGGSQILSLVSDDGSAQTINWWNTSWTDGDPTASAPFNHSNWIVNADGEQITMQVAGIGNSQTLNFYATAYDATGTITASVSGGGGSDSDTLTANAAEGRMSQFSIAFDALVGQTLTVVFEQSGSGGVAPNIGFSAATLDTGTVIPEPSSFVLMLSAVVLGAVVLKRKR